MLHYAYSGVGFTKVVHLAPLPRPARSVHFANDLYLNLDLRRTPNANVMVLVPNDRGLANAAWIPSLRFAVLATDNTARATLARPPLRLDTSAHQPRAAQRAAHQPGARRGRHPC